jgi:hypothetical protein
VSEAAGVKLGQVAQPLRAALTGRATSPGIFDVLVLLGREESLARIADQMTQGEIKPWQTARTSRSATSSSDSRSCRARSART